MRTHEHTTLMAFGDDFGEKLSFFAQQRAKRRPLGFIRGGQ
jgi:hypothetical protein